MFIYVDSLPMPHLSLAKINIEHLPGMKHCFSHPVMNAVPRETILFGHLTGGIPQSSVVYMCVHLWYKAAALCGQPTHSIRTSCPTAHCIVTHFLSGICAMCWLLGIPARLVIPRLGFFQKKPLFLLEEEPVLSRSKTALFKPFL